jgi:membrane fusion protein, multidrug efflux system
MQADRKSWLGTFLWISICLFLTACDKQTSAQEGHQAGPVEVGVVKVESQRVEITSELPGRTAAHLIAEVRPQVGGIIQKRQFVEGGDVKAGEVLYQIDPAAYQAAHASAKAALGKAEAVLMTTQSKANRYKSLLPLKAVSQQDYEDVAGQLKQAEADVESCKASLTTARINLDYTRVTSPISGRVGRSSVTTGALVTASQGSALCTVQQLDPIYVDMTQSSVEMLRMKQDLANGQLKNGGVKEAKVRLLLEDGTLYPPEGSLKFSEVTVDQSTGAITLRAVFPNPEQLLLPGMYVRAVIHQGVQEQGIVVPQRGVTRDPRGNASALVVGSDGKVEQRSVTIARALGNKWLVGDGLKAGDQLIVEGLQKVQPGVAVKVVPFAEQQPPGPVASADSKP